MPVTTRPKTTRKPIAFVLLAVMAAPLLWSLVGAASAAMDRNGWDALFQATQTLPALAMSVWTGLLSTTLAALLAASILAATVGLPHRHAHTQRLARWLAPMLAVPHAAFAIGLAALVAPSGWMLRALSPWATRLDAPPPWPTTQDPWGVGLVAVLVCKEVPFLLWVAVAHLQRPDVAHRLRQELQLAHTMGYSAAQAWWRVGWPQLLSRLAAPLLAVLSYGLTVVDVAMVIGPTTPPTLAVLAWQWLQDGDAATNAQGAAAAWLLLGVFLASATTAWAALQAPQWRRRWSTGVAAPTKAGAAPLAEPLQILLTIYCAVLLALLVGSVTGTWPFPQWVPEHWTLEAWRSVASSTPTLRTTFWLAFLSSAWALVWAVAWLECSPVAWRAPVQKMLWIPLVLPAVLWVVGLHRVALAWQLDAQASGLLLAHTLTCLPYVLLTLQGQYLSFDERFGHVSSTLGHSHWRFLLQVKWTMLRAPLAASSAVGFAVSVAQYLPTLYLGAGRFSTVTTEAVTLSANAQRSLTSAYAGLQWLLPAVVFGLAARLGRARLFRSILKP
jgi:putative thiamine transport system permease protein